MFKKYPGCTPIEKYLCSYTLSKKSTVASNTAQVYQFPVVVCFAATTHKFQGGTIVKPNKLVADLRTVFEDAMAYVMLSRVQDKNQLFIVGSLPENKFRVSAKCLKELKRLTSKSVNKNPPTWERVNRDSIKILALNCHSLEDKFFDIKYDRIIMYSDVICLTETWLQSDHWREDLDLEGYKQHFNSYGNERGKGLAMYYKEEKFRVASVIKHSDLQITKLSSNDIDILSVYRSKSCKDAHNEIVSIIDPSKTTLICGDFNVCFIEKQDHPLIKSLLSLGFEQKVKAATHIEGGLIDQVS